MVLGSVYVGGSDPALSIRWIPEVTAAPQDGGSTRRLSSLHQGSQGDRPPRGSCTLETWSWWKLGGLPQGSDSLGGGSSKCPPCLDPDPQKLRGSRQRILMVGLLGKARWARGTSSLPCLVPSFSGSELSLDSALWRGYLLVGSGTPKGEFMGYRRARLSTFHDNIYKGRG